MTALLTSGAIFGVILILMIIEACVLIPYYRTTGSGISPIKLICSLLAGGGILLAACAVLLHAPAACIGLSLMLALLAHVADLKFRWRSATKNSLAVGKQKLNANAMAQSNHA